MSFNNRRVTNQATVTGVRTVSYSVGGLNERFSQLDKTKVVAPKAKVAKDSVFSRLRGLKTAPGRVGRLSGTNIQNRLGKINTPGATKKKPFKKATPAVNSRKPVKKQVRKPTQPKKMSAEDLDKSLDAYMMKDPKTAQAKLDAELNAYMDEAGDTIMEDL
ncbi:hypothetical protein BDB01DRAFT_898745 [Pilobolus umbonatus]|nr:hypothetical protein BDB01DRAFT_898745 [Pilobolus umbonatus]